MIRDLFATDLPIIQAPMAGVQGARLAVAVSNAGALGSLPTALLTTDSLRSELRQIQAESNKPYNVNFFCHTPPVPDAERDRAWRLVLALYFEEYGIDPDTIKDGPARLPFNSDIADIVEEFKPPVVSFHFGLPSADLVQRVQTWGSKVIASATTVAEALWLQARGIDGIIAQGSEAGGHRGMFLTDDVATQLGTFALVPQIKRAVDLPVIAAGGIADAAGVRASLALGADGVQVGTAYLLCMEATTSAVHRAALESDAARVTAITNIFTGRPARAIANRAMRELGYINKAAPAFPLASSAFAPLRTAAEQKGSSDFSPLWCGQNATGCKSVPADMLTKELASGVDRTP